MNTGCGCVDSDGAPRPGSDYTGILCSACYRALELRLSDLSGLISYARSETGGLRAAPGGERVQSSGELKIPLRIAEFEAANELYTAAALWITYFSVKLAIPPPFHLREFTGTGREPDGIPYWTNRVQSEAAVSSTQSWLCRNLWIIASDLSAVQLSRDLGRDLASYRRRWIGEPIRRRARRGRCGTCAARAVTIELREKSTFVSTCGGCGAISEVGIATVEAVLGADGPRNQSGAGGDPANGDELEGVGAGSPAGATGGNHLH